MTLLPPPALPLCQEKQVVYNCSKYHERHAGDNASTVPAQWLRAATYDARTGLCVGVTPNGCMQTLATDNAFNDVAECARVCSMCE